MVPFVVQVPVRTTVLLMEQPRYQVPKVCMQVIPPQLWDMRACYSLDIGSLLHVVTAVDIGVGGDQKLSSLDLTQFPDHMHLEVHGDEIKSASLPDGFDPKAVHPRASTLQKAHVVCMSSDHQLLRVRTKKPDPSSPGANPQVYVASVSTTQNYVNWV
jgi:hypothetical protein